MLRACRTWASRPAGLAFFAFSVLASWTFAALSRRVFSRSAWAFFSALASARRISRSLRPLAALRSARRTSSFSFAGAFLTARTTAARRTAYWASA